MKELYRIVNYILSLVGAFCIVPLWLSYENEGVPLWCAILVQTTIIVKLIVGYFQVTDRL